MYLIRNYVQIFMENSMLEIFGKMENGKTMEKFSFLS